MEIAFRDSALVRCVLGARALGIAGNLWVLGKLWLLKEVFLCWS